MFKYPLRAFFGVLIAVFSSPVWATMYCFSGDAGNKPPELFKSSIKMTVRILNNGGKEISQISSERTEFSNGVSFYTQKGELTNLVAVVEFDENTGDLLHLNSMLAAIRPVFSNSATGTCYYIVE